MICMCVCMYAWIDGWMDITLCMFCIFSFQPPPSGWTQPIRGGATRPGAGIIYIAHIAHIVGKEDAVAAVLEDVTKGQRGGIWRHKPSKPSERRAVTPRGPRRLENLKLEPLQHLFSMTHMVFSHYVPCFFTCFPHGFPSRSMYFTCFFP